MGKLCKKAGRVETAEGLPDFCYSRLAADKSPIVIKKGETGYHPMKDPDFDVDDGNYNLGVTAAQRKAMETGSLFGWDAPAADPAVWERILREKRSAGKAGQ